MPVNPNDIRSVPDWQSLTAQEVLDYWSTADPKPRTDSRYTMVGLLDKFGTIEIAMISVGIKQAAAGLNSTGNPTDAVQAEMLLQFLASLQVSGGVDFANAKTVEALQQLELAGIMTPEDVAAFTQLGFDTRTPWQRRMGESAELPTLLEIENALTLANAQDVAGQFKASIINDVLTPAVERGDSIETIKAAVAAWGE